MTDAAFPDAARIDAYDKVRGGTRYGADDARPGLVHAALAVAQIGRGRLLTVDTEAARAAPGVRLVLTHLDLPNVQSAGFLMSGGYGFQSFQPMLADVIAYRGQPIALVAADTLPQAIAGAELIRATYDAQPFNVTLDAPDSDILAQADSPLPQPAYADVQTGDADGVFADAEIKIDRAFTSPVQHPNPIELIATVAEWNDGVLTVHEGTQNAEGVRHGLARQLGLTADKVVVLSPYVGGGFGQKNSLQMQTVLAAVAARRLERPVKIVVPRRQIYHDSAFRPASRHRFRLSADRSGKLTAAIHEVDSQTSRHDLFPCQYTQISSRLYGVENFRGHERFVRTDVQTPGYMRAPYEHIATFVMESCVDEVAYELGMDPVELRLKNDTQIDQISKKPLSSRHLSECLTRGAKKFGWNRRTMAPQSMTAPDGSAIGWGVGIGAYKAATAPAVARIRCSADGSVFVSVGISEMGQGSRTAIVAAVSRKLGVPPHQITVVVGDTRATPQHTTAGSWGTATAIPAVSEAAETMAKALAELNPGGEARTPGEILAAAGRPVLEIEQRRKAPGQPDAVYDRLTSGLPAALGPVYPDFASFSYIAHFVEVRIEPGTRRIRVPRVVSVADCGRVVSPRTARSQVMGGVVWGISAALREATEIDPRYGGFLNPDLAEYVMPVNLDIQEIDVEFIDRPDYRLNSVGAKGLGEVAMTGVAAAIGNAVFHATGRRVRDLPIRFEHML